MVGGEGSGLRRLVKEKCDVLFSIPMWGSVRIAECLCGAGVTLLNTGEKNVM